MSKSCPLLWGAQINCVPAKTKIPSASLNLWSIALRTNNLQGYLAVQQLFLWVYG